MDAREQFEEMYLAHGPALRTFVYRRTDAAVADDLVAEVFFLAWRRFAEAPKDPLPWLIGIARGVLSNHRRGQVRRRALHERLRDTAPRDEALPDGGAENPSAVMEVLTSLSERDQEILLLVAWDGLDRSQAAHALGMTKPQFAVRLHRARRRLQHALDVSRQPHPRSEQPRSTSEVS